MDVIRLPCFKNLKKSPVKIGTHNGTFHCDEALGTYMLQLLIPDSIIVRSRDPDKLRECDIVIDVGNEYNPDKFLFDHHQKGFNESMSTVIQGKPWTTKLSSAGLVYCHFGKEVIKKIIGEEKTESEVESVFDHVYENFIQEIDAVDNGVPMYDGEPAYRITTNLSSRVQEFNKPWTTGDEDFDEDAVFSTVQSYVGDEFKGRLLKASNSWLPARNCVYNAITSRFSVSPGGLVIELEKFCPWKGHFFKLEKDLEVKRPILFVIFPDKDNWRVQAVSVNEGSYICRLFLHSEWHGLRDKELSQVAGIDGCIFAHHTGFIGGNKTRDGALMMALKSIELNKNNV